MKGSRTDAGPTAAARPGSSGRSRRLVLAVLAVAVLCVALGTPLLGSYGPTWDLALGEYGYGHDWLDAVEHGRTAELGPGYVRSAESRAPHPDFDGSRFPPQLVYPLGAMASALSCDLLWSAWGVLPAMSAHHVPVLLCLAALLATLVLMGGRRLGPWAAAGAVLAAVGQPQLLAHGLHNLKDFPEAVLYTCSRGSPTASSSCARPVARTSPNTSSRDGRRCSR